jgi:hypothetical protein
VAPAVEAPVLSPEQARDELVGLLRGRGCDASVVEEVAGLNLEWMPCLLAEARVPGREACTVSPLLCMLRVKGGPNADLWQIEPSADR